VSYRTAAGLVLLSLGAAAGALAWAIDYSLGWEHRP
jgi:hypothetical protein